LGAGDRGKGKGERGKGKKKKAIFPPLLPLDKIAPCP